MTSAVVGSEEALAVGNVADSLRTSYYPKEWQTGGHQDSLPEQSVISQKSLTERCNQAAAWQRATAFVMGQMSKPPVLTREQRALAILAACARGPDDGRWEKHGLNGAGFFIAPTTAPAPLLVGSQLTELSVGCRTSSLGGTAYDHDVVDHRIIDPMDPSNFLPDFLMSHELSALKKRNANGDLSSGEQLKERNPTSSLSFGRSEEKEEEKKDRALTAPSCVDRSDCRTMIERSFRFELRSRERRELTRFLNADGLEERPGFVLKHLSWYKLILPIVKKCAEEDNHFGTC